MKIYGPDYHPRFTIEDAAQEAFETVERVIMEAGGEVVNIYIAIRATGIGDPDTVSAGHGFENGQEVLVELLENARGTAKQLGLDMSMFALPKGQG